MPCHGDKAQSFRELRLLSNSKRIKLLSSAMSACLNFITPFGWKSLSTWIPMPWIPHSSSVTWRKHKRQNYFQMLYMNPLVWPIGKMPGSGYLVWQVLINREWRSPIISSSRALAGLQLISRCATSMKPESVFTVPLVTAHAGATNKSRSAALPLLHVSHTLSPCTDWHLRIGKMPYDPECPI